MSERKVVCFYHGADLDGFCSGAIVASVYGWDEITLVPVDYAAKTDLTQIDEHTEVLLVDYCFPMEDMARINETAAKFIWIDHHDTAIKSYTETLEAGGIGEIEGLREEGTAACKLTWMFFHPEHEVPQAVEYLHAYDVWKWEGVENAIEFQYGMRLWENKDPRDAQQHVFDEDTEDYSPVFKWNALLHNITMGAQVRYARKLLADIIYDGSVVWKYQQTQNAMGSKSSCFATSIDGLPVIAANVGGANSMFFDAVVDKFPDAKALCTFQFRRKRWNFSLFKILGRDTPHLGEFCAKHGGGGHPGAAGFSVDATELKMILRECEIE